ncbi:MAG TPA: hypothetical protein PLB76_11610 [Anaerohalosphaeraceae bacterium]|nr:hypothetical protein [Anaerohalosphaeraceae bacterium]
MKNPVFGSGELGGWRGVLSKIAVFFVFGLKMGFLVKFAHRGAQAARILKPFKNGRAHFKAGFWTCGGVGAHF